MSHAGKSLSKADQHLDQVKKVLLQVRKCPTKKLLEESLVGFIDKHKVVHSHTYTHTQDRSIVGVEIYRKVLPIID